MTSIRAFARRAGESFWLYPTIFGIVAIVLAEALVLLDRGLVDRGETQLFFLDSLSASGGRSILSIIGSSVLTVAGTSFSITISVLATTSSTYGPRLVRNFLADRLNQIVLATFTSTFLYALLVLRSVRTVTDDGGGFVPVVAIHVAVLLGVANVAVLVIFIHHIANSVQITTIQRRVQDDLVAAVDLVFPAERSDTERTAAGPTSSRPSHPGERSSGRTIVVVAQDHGYVEDVDLEALRDIARSSDCVVEVLAMPGTHVVEGEPLAEITTGGGESRSRSDTSTDDTSPDGAGSDEVAQHVRGSFALGASRTPHQDVRFALQQLVEVAVRGLASGTNDPYTAVTALDLSAVALVPMVSRQEAPESLADDRGAVRVLVSWPTRASLLDDVFSAVESYGMEHPLVVDAATRLCARLLPHLSGDLREQVAAVDRRLASARLSPLP